MPRMIEVEIDSVRVSLTNQQRIVILKEKDQERYLPIWIGLYEAEAITIALQKIQVARPQTHDLLKTLIQSLNAQLVQVEITSLSDDVFYGSLVLESNGVRSEVDCRPSDALALAARYNVPIYIAENVMHLAGITPEEDIAGIDGGDEEGAPAFNPSDESLDIFEDFLQNMDFNSEDDSPDDETDETGDNN